MHPRRLLLCSTALVLFGCALPQLCAQSEPPAPPSKNADPFINIDNMCRIVTFDTTDPSHPKPHYKSDRTLCRIESPAETTVWKKRNLNGQIKSVMVDIREKEYILQNPYDHAITFHVHHPVPKNYHVESEPQPNQLANSIAVFYVVVQAAQTARLHVGMSN